jgi:hypothetical protein
VRSKEQSRTPPSIVPPPPSSLHRAKMKTAAEKQKEVEVRILGV